MATWSPTDSELLKLRKCVKNQWLESPEITSPNNSSIKSKLIIYPKGFQSNDNLSLYLQITKSSNNFQLKYNIHTDINDINWNGYCEMNNEKNTSCQLDYKPKLDKFYEKFKNITFNWNIELIKHQNYEYDYSESDEDKQDNITQEHNEVKTTDEQNNNYNIQNSVNCMQTINCNNNTFEWVIPNKLLNSFGRAANSTMFSLYNCKWKFRLNLENDFTLALCLLDKPDYVESITMLTDMFIPDINVYFSSVISLGEERNGTSLWPTRYIKRSDIMSLPVPRIQINIKMKYPKIKMHHKIGKLFQMSNLRMFYQISHIWSIPMALFLMNSCKGDVIVSQRFDAWQLRIYPQGTMRGSSAFQISFQNVIIPFAMCNLSVQIKLRLKQLNHIWKENATFGCKNSYIVFKLSQQMETAIKNLNEVTFECDINVIKAVNRSGQEISKYNEDIFYQNIVCNVNPVSNNVRIPLKFDANLKKWFDELNMSQYFNLFVENGWDSCKSMQLMTKENFNEIGIRKAGHKAVLWNEIESRTWMKEGDK